MSPSSSRRLRVLAIALLVGGGLACATLSIDQERKLGDEFSREIRKEIVFLRDETVQAYVETIGRNILASAGTQPFEYHFYVVDDPELNAFAAPAGHVYLNTGIILNARNVGELLGAEGVRVVLLVTHAVHMPRATEAFEQAGVRVYAAPMGYSGSASAGGALQWLPSMSGLGKSYKALHEHLGRFWYGIRY